MGNGQIVGYQRVATVDQNTERQLDGIALDEVFTDHASGKDTTGPRSPSAWPTCARATSWSCIRWTG